MHDQIKRVCWLAVLAGVPFFFVPIPGGELVQRLQDVGHLLYFGAIGVLLTQFVPSFRRLPFSRQLLAGGLFAILAGGTIEMAQLFSHRDASVDDVRRDLIGLLVAIALLSSARTQWPRAPRSLMLGLLLLAVVLECRPAYLQWQLEQHARRIFPRLSDFEYAEELRLWTNGHIEKSGARSGGAALELSISSIARFSATTMAVVQGDWRSYRTLHLSIHRQSDRRLPIWVRVIDETNIRNDYAFDDRFQRAFETTAGWNDFDITLGDIANGPPHRKLDLSRIRELSIYTVDAGIDETILVDNIRLQ